MTLPTCVIPAAGRTFAPMTVARTGEALADTAILVAQPGLRVAHDVLPPGRRSASPHAHTTQDEVHYVLCGTPDLWLDGTLHRLQPGDAVFCRAGSGEAHTLVNHTAEDVHVLTVARLEPDDEVRYAPQATV